MNAPARLSLYGLGLIGAFAAAFLVAGAVAPGADVAARTTTTDDDRATHDEPSAAQNDVAMLPGLSMEADGYRLSEVEAPAAVGETGELRFSVLDPDGQPLLDYTEEHEKDLHLIVVREDGTRFRHVHPELDASGTWSLPWTWGAAGSYRVFADFTAAAAERGVTLARTISVAGDFTPVPPQDEVREARAGDFDVALSGDLVAGGSSTLTLEVTRDGEAVTTMQPYLGAFGHLVALRDGDLAYLHVHPEGAAPEAGQRSGPSVVFAAEAPTPGRYLLYFDFQVDDEVHSASFVVATGDQAAPAESHAPADDGHDDH